MKKKTDKEFKKEMKELYGNEYTVLGKYNGNKENIEIRHNACGNILFIKPNKILRNHTCAYCSGKIKKTTESVRKEIDENTNGEYELIGEYKNNKTPISVRYKKTGEIIENVILRQFINGKYRIKDNDKIFKDKVFTLVGDEYSVLSKYIGIRDKIKIRHNKCGCEYEIIAETFLAGCRCKKCSIEANRKGTQKFKEEVAALDDEYEFIDEYKNNSTLSKFKHLDHEFLMRPYDFIHGHRCPICSTFRRSYGARNIKKYLEENKIKYISEYKIIGCKDKKELPFDFYIPEKELLIEFDGEQHFFPVGFGGDKEMLFELQKKHDEIKDQYCRDNKIKLLRIPYWYKKDIKNIMNKSINMEYAELEKYNKELQKKKEDS